MATNVTLPDPALLPRWYAIKTRSRHEKTVAEQLVGKDVSCFLPTYEVARNWGGRRAFVQLPLFNGYLFVNIPLRERMKVLTTYGVASFIGINGHPLPVPDEQIHAILTFVEEKLKYDPYPYVREGQPVEIRRGPLKGIRGVLVQKRNRFKFVVSIDLIQQAVALEIDASDVEPL